MEFDPGVAGKGGHWTGAQADGNVAVVVVFPELEVKGAGHHMSNTGERADATAGYVDEQAVPGGNLAGPFPATFGQTEQGKTVLLVDLLIS